MMIFSNIFFLLRKLHLTLQEVQNKTHCVVCVDTYQAKSTASGLLAIPGFSINSGEKNGKCVGL